MASRGLLFHQFDEGFESSFLVAQKEGLWSLKDRRDGGSEQGGVDK